VRSTDIALIISLSISTAGCLPFGRGSSGYNGSSGGPGGPGYPGDGLGAPGIASPTRPADPHLVVAGAGQGLTRVTADPVEEYLPVLSPDGKMLLFEAMTRKVDADGKVQADVNQQVLISCSPKGGGGRTIYTPSGSLSGTPSWLPDGKGFVFLSNAMGDWNLVRTLSNTPSGAIQLILRGDMAPMLDHPSVAPDGKRVTFEMSVSSTKYIGVVGTDGSSFTQLTEGFGPSWGPDGRQIAFTRKIGQRNQVFLVNADTGQGLVQVTSDDSDNTNPAWSPDGRYLVFQSNRGWSRFPGAVPERTWNLYAVKPDGTALTQLTDGAFNTQQPSWGRDGWIYFSSNSGGNPDIWRLWPSGELVPWAPGSGAPVPAPVSPTPPAK